MWFTLRSWETDGGDEDVCGEDVHREDVRREDVRRVSRQDSRTLSSTLYRISTCLLEGLGLNKWRKDGVLSESVEPYGIEDYRCLVETGWKFTGMIQLAHPRARNCALLVKKLTH